MCSRLPARSANSRILRGRVPDGCGRSTRQSVITPIISRGQLRWREAIAGSYSSSAAPRCRAAIAGTPSDASPRKRMAEDGARVLVVVSALSGVTNELQAIADRRATSIAGAHRRAGRAPSRVLRRTRSRRRCRARRAPRRAAARWRPMPRAGERTLDWQAEVLAQGELLSSTLGAAYLRSQGLDFGWCDARNGCDARVAAERERLGAAAVGELPRATGDAACGARFAAQAAPMLLTQGFIARHGDGGTAILGRGGSDTSAAYFGALLRRAARGDLDRRARHVQRQSARSARRAPAHAPGLRRGAGNRHDRRQGAASALDRAVPRRRRADGDPRHRTLPTCPARASTRSAATVPGVKAISRRNGIVLVSMETHRHVAAGRLPRRRVRALQAPRPVGRPDRLVGNQRHRVARSAARTWSTPTCWTRCRADLAEVCRVKVIAPCAAITLVGRGMRSLLHKLSDIWATFGRERVHLISQSSNDLNLTFVIDEADADGTAAATARRADPRRRDAGARAERVRPELARDRARQAANARRAVVAWRSATSCCACAAAGHAALRLRPARRCASARARCARSRAIDRRFYAIKANPHPAILRALVDEGFGLECVSQGELEHVFATLPALDRRSRVLFTPSFAPRARVRSGVRARRHRHARQRRSAAALAGDVPRPHDRGCASTWATATATTRRSRTGGVAAKFGLPLARFDAFLAEARAARRPHQRPARAPRQRHRRRRALARGLRANWPDWPTASAPSRPSTSAAACRSRTRRTREPFDLDACGARAWPKSRRRIRATRW